MISKASALIYTREKHIGFPGGWFKVQPEDFPKATAKRLLDDYAMAAMEDVKQLRSAHKQVRVVIVEDGYVILGIAAYLRDLFSDGWEGVDERNRPVYGFLGFVWKQNDFNQCCHFPTLDHFANLVSDYIRPKWDLSKSSHWATHQELVPFQYSPCTIPNEAILDFTPHKIEAVENADKLVQWAINKAASGEIVSVSTNVTIYDIKSYTTPYQYVSCNTSNQKNIVNRSTVENRKQDKEEVNEDVDHLENNKEVGMLPQNDVSKISDLVDIPQKKSKNAIPRALIGIGILLMILVLVSTPVAWMAGILWKMLLVGAVACISVGVIRLLQDRKKQEEKTDTDRAVIEAKQPSSPIVVDPLKAGAKVEKIEKKPVVKLDRPKKPEEETTEDLFRF